MREEPFYFTPPPWQGAAPSISFLLTNLQFVGVAEAFRFQHKKRGRCFKCDRKRQYAASGRFFQTGLRRCVRFALLSAKRYFALECFARTRIGFVALSEPNQPRLGSPALPRSPESGVEVSTHAKFLSRKKTLYVEEFL